MGRKPKPTNLKVLQGNPGHRPINRNEPKPTPLSSVDPPGWLSDDAKKVWTDAAGDLARIGILTTADIEVFSVGCEFYALWMRAMERVNNGEATGVSREGNEVVGSWFKIARESAKVAMSVYTEFGKTPASRAKLSVEPTDKKKLWGDALNV